MKYPLGIQTFEKIRTEGFVYIDKTRLIYDMVQNGQYYFLSRPRRFGKSLLLSTIEAYFQGRKDLFAGLDIYRLEKDWVQHPVFHIDLNIGNYQTVDGLRTQLDYILSENEAKYGIDKNGYDYSQRLSQLIQQAALATNNKVVVLVDEYDKPLLDTIHDEKLHEQMRAILRAFYSVIKTQDQYIRFTLLTGVTKFGHLSVFSGLNNPTDISFRPQYSTICGITETEMLQTFADGIERLSAYYDCTTQEMIAKLRQMYDGYRFSREDCLVYNPYSILRAFDDGYMEPYWFETGTPNYLVELMQKHHYKISSLEGTKTDQSRLSNIDTGSSDPIPIIYQSGYLTIKDYDKERNRFTLGFPNEEVRSGFMKYLWPFYSKTRDRKVFDVESFVDDLEKGDADGFMSRLMSLTADISYEIQANCENDFQNLLYIICTLSGISAKPEVHTSDGSIDLVIENSEYVFIMEFKINGTARKAIDQIETKKYTLPWEKSPKKIFKIGANFSTVHRRLTDYIIIE